ncbi:hypothetical protein BU23DRAFT_115825 [Bimuria novae-zelandiae CBS 107.79]|uniref:Uncharacterized protein n=1 Tax=Bimuria novae-zelandiae CBS 107.79 TaxID=1447943 RepID=A0A6A5VCE0_9PLEO|nr:hypothetical protein BU23DRAFT_115825 [Bimuria novae-zelandiae CBS 107.79]
MQATQTRFPRNETSSLIRSVLPQPHSSLYFLTYDTDGQALGVRSTAERGPVVPARRLPGTPSSATPGHYIRVSCVSWRFTHSLILLSHMLSSVKVLRRCSRPRIHAAKSARERRRAGEGGAFVSIVSSFSFNQLPLVGVAEYIRWKSAPVPIVQARHR